ncbi:hypothetical protein BJ165DRAFT_1528701 [Panaeolus papilionaceus]|nr:hypothetical protein BJ165DRAFT_1528701 [Panaeolus papilionaceus]
MSESKSGKFNFWQKIKGGKSKDRPVKPQGDNNSTPQKVDASTSTESRTPVRGNTLSVASTTQETAQAPQATPPSQANGCEVKPHHLSNDGSTTSDVKSTSTNGQEVNTSDHDIVMIVMGPTGVGKTTFIDSFNNESYSRSDSDINFSKVGHHDLSAGTQEVNVATFKLKETGVNLVLVDTPGFDDADRSDAVVLTCIAKYLEDRYRQKEYLNGLIYLHRITDVRFDAGSSNALNIFKKLYGTDGYDKLALVTTMWNDIRPEMKYKYEEKENELKENAWGNFLKRTNHALVARYDATDEQTKKISALQVVTDLMQNQLHNPTPSPPCGGGSLPNPLPTPEKLKLRIQKELVDEKKALPWTEAGKAAFTLAETAKYYLKQI